jgi:ribosomal protein L29
MKAAQYREQAEAELQQVLKDTRVALFDVRRKSGGGDNAAPPTQARLLRRDIARIRTVQNERKAAGHG